MNKAIFFALVVWASTARADVIPLQSFPATSRGSCPSGTVYYADVHQCYCYSEKDCETARNALLERKKKQEQEQKQSDQLEKQRDQELRVEELEKRLQKQEQRLRQQERILEEQQKTIRDLSEKTKISPK